jgi:D-beta-D-heptose 7-phosphate kinase/D-beta-D-heptose 1-phosphate adenosyltransferase
MPKVLVYGDVMLDVYITGSVKRDSPEAPGVPILSQHDIEYYPGGAANVAANIASLGGAPLLIGVVGPDPSAEILETVVTGVAMELMVRRDGRTTAKTRFVADGRHLLRLDMECPDSLDAADERELCARLPALVKRADAVVISDYAKGAVTPMLAALLIRLAKLNGIPVVVDAKQPAAQYFHGATVIKPNLKEIAAALGMQEPPQTDKDVVRAATLLWSKSKGTPYILLTRGEKGMCLVGDEGAMKVEPHAVKEVDVTGAGDTVAAALTMALARGEDIIEAAHFANAAAAVVVTKWGTACPTPAEVQFFYDRDSDRDRAAGRPVAPEAVQNRLH